MQRFLPKLAADLAVFKGFGLGNADFADGVDGLGYDGSLHKVGADYSGWAWFPLLQAMAEAHFSLQGGERQIV